MGKTLKFKIWCLWGWEKEIAAGNWGNLFWIYLGESFALIYANKDPPEDHRDEPALLLYDFVYKTLLGLLNLAIDLEKIISI